MDEAVDSDDVAQAVISWPRAIATVVLIALGGVGLLAYGTNYLLNHLTSVDRSQRVAIATTFFMAVLLGLALALRRLQRRGLI